MRVAVVMDSIARVKYIKDTTLGLLFEAAKLGFELHYIEKSTLTIHLGYAQGISQALTVRADAADFYTVAAPQQRKLAEFDIILMRQDPPFNAQFLYNTHVLSLAELQGATVVNNPQMLRDYNEKIYSCHFAKFAPDTLVSSNMAELYGQYQQWRDVIIKPLDGMGGKGILHIKPNDDNAHSAIELLSADGHVAIMMQQYIAAVAQGDKRVLLIDGEPVAYCLARVPLPHEARANLAAGGVGVTQPLGTRDREIATVVGDQLQGKGLHLVGIDIIGKYLIEINVTSPTGIREVTRDSGVDIAALFWNSVLSTA